LFNTTSFDRYKYIKEELYGDDALIFIVETH